MARADEYAKFDLTLNAGGRREGIEGELGVCDGAVRGETIARMWGMWRRVLEEMTEDSRGVDWGSGDAVERERQQVVEEWNKTEREYAGGMCAGVV